MPPLFKPRPTAREMHGNWIGAVRCGMPTFKIVPGNRKSSDGIISQPVKPVEMQTGFRVDDVRR